MPYVIVTTYHTGKDDLRDRLLMQHMDYLDQHVGRLLNAGGLVTDDNCTTEAAMYVLDTEDRAEAERFVANEPFVQGGLIASTSIRRWRKSYYNRERLLADPMRTSAAAIKAMGAPPLSGTSAPNK